MDSMKTSETYQNRMLRMARIRTGFMALSTALLLVIGYFALLMGGQLQGVLNEAQGTFQTLNTLATEIQKANISGMLDDVSALVENAQDTVDGAMDGVGQAAKKIDELDISTLNKAITDLAAVVEPLAKLFGGAR